MKKFFRNLLYRTKLYGVYLMIYDLYLCIRIIKNISYYRNTSIGNKYFIKLYHRHVAEMKEHFVHWVKTGELN